MDLRPLDEPEPDSVQRGLRHWRPVGGGEEKEGAPIGGENNNTPVDFPLEEPEPDRVQRGPRHWRRGGEEEKEKKKIVKKDKLLLFTNLSEKK